MTNDSVLKMFHAGLGQALILQTIQTQPGAYDVSTEAIIALKQAGLPDPILNAMMAAAGRPPLAPAAPTTVLPVIEPGVYYKGPNGQWLLMDSEPVQIVSGGLLKSTLSQGIIREDRNGRIFGREATLVLQRPVQILIFTPESVTDRDYDLLRLRVNGKDREFRTVTGGVLHTTAGAQRDEVTFHATETAPRTFVFTLDAATQPGEYGVLPPGTGNLANAGKIYTFSIKE
jgi:hypothetical protein